MMNFSLFRFSGNCASWFNIDLSATLCTLAFGKTALKSWNIFTLFSFCIINNYIFSFSLSF